MKMPSSEPVYGCMSMMPAEVQKKLEQLRKLSGLEDPCRQVGITSLL
jgi:hypothetical protein